MNKDGRDWGEDVGKVLRLSDFEPVDAECEPEAGQPHEAGTGFGESPAKLVADVTQACEVVELDEEYGLVRPVPEGARMVQPTIPPIRLPKWVSMLLMLIAGVTGLLISYRVLQFISFLSTVEPLWVYYPALVSVAICLLVIMYALLRLISSFRRLRVTLQEDPVFIHNRARPTEVDASDGGLAGQISAWLRSYVDSCPVDDDTGRQGGKSAGSDNLEWAPFGYVDRQTLREGKRRVLETPVADSERFIEAYREHFQSLLDEAAERTVVESARWVGIKTAASPYAILDLGIILFESARLIGTLCRIYGVRMGRIGTLRVMAAVLAHAYLAAKIDDIEPWAEEGFSKLLDTVGVQAVMGSFFSKLSVKASSGYVNYRLFARMGRDAIRLLQPLTPEFNPVQVG